MRDVFHPGWAEYCFGLLVTATWQATVLLALALPATVLVRRAALRYYIWASCIVGMLVVPLVSLLLPHCFLAYGSDYEPLHFPTHIAQPSVYDANGIWSRSSGWWSDVRRWLIVVWGVGAVAAMLRLIWGWVGMIKLMRMARPCNHLRVQRILSKVTDGPERVTVLELDSLVGAICWQFHHAVMILPADAHRLADQQLEMMIRHELGHLYRSDPGMVFVQRIAEVFYWFHPALWLATVQTSKYREFACDDFVLAAGHRPKDYAACLGQLAIWFYTSMPLAPAGVGIVWNQHLVIQRVKRILAAEDRSFDVSCLVRRSFVFWSALVMFAIGVARVDWSAGRFGTRVRWTAWPRWTAGVLDMAGIRVLDYPLDAHSYDDAVRESRS